MQSIAEETGSTHRSTPSVPDRRSATGARSSNYPEIVRGVSKLRWLGVVVSVLGLVLATFCFVLADGEGAVILVGVLASASGLLGFATFFLSKRPRSPSDDIDETAR